MTRSQGQNHPQRAPPAPACQRGPREEAEAVSREGGPHLLAAACSWTSQPPELREINACCSRAAQSALLPGPDTGPQQTPRPSVPVVMLTFFSFLTPGILRERTTQDHAHWMRVGEGRGGADAERGLLGERPALARPMTLGENPPFLAIPGTPGPCSAGASWRGRSEPLRPTSPTTWPHGPPWPSTISGRRVWQGPHGTLRRVSLSDSKVRITPKLHTVDTTDSPTSRGSRTTKPLPSTFRMGGSWWSSLGRSLFFLDPFCSCEGRPGG